MLRISLVVAVGTGLLAPACGSGTLGPAPMLEASGAWIQIGHGRARLREPYHAIAADPARPGVMRFSSAAGPERYLITVEPLPPSFEPGNLNTCKTLASATLPAPDWVVSQTEIGGMGQRGSCTFRLGARDSEMEVFGAVIAGREERWKLVCLRPLGSDAGIACDALVQTWKP